MFRPEHEGGLGEAIGAGRGGGNDGRTAHLAGRAARAWIDDVVIAYAILVEVALVISRCGDGSVLQRDAGDHFVLAVGMADADHPGIA